MQILNVTQNEKHQYIHFEMPLHNPDTRKKQTAEGVYANRADGDVHLQEVIFLRMGNYFYEIKTGNKLAWGFFQTHLNKHNDEVKLRTLFNNDKVAEKKFNDMWSNILQQPMSPPKLTASLLKKMIKGIQTEGHNHLTLDRAFNNFKSAGGNFLN